VTDRRAYAYGFAAAAVILAAAGLAFDLFVADEHADFSWIAPGVTAVIVGPAAFGVIVVRRQPGNLIGLLLTTQGAALGLMAFVDRMAYAGLDEPGLPGWEWAILANDVLWPLMFSSLVAIAFVFPDGRLLPGRGWRWTARAGLLGLVGSILGMAASRDALPEPWADVERPMPDALEFLAWLMAIAMPAALFAVLAAVWAVRTRFKAATGVERQQLRWLALASLIVPIALAIGFLGGNDSIAGVAAVIAGTAIPAAIAVAITRYRLYELDHLVSRTLVYATLTVLLGAAYFGVSLAAGLATGDSGRFATAAATLAVAAAFRPLRARVQRAVDRRFDRVRYEVLDRIERFNANVREGSATPESIGHVLASALGDPTLELLFWLPESQLHVDAEGHTRDPADTRGRESTPVRRGALELGVVLHARAERPATLDAAVSAAGLAIEIARLRVEVRRQLAEVDASRARIVAAGDDERRRLERDLHDGAQQRLVSIGLALRHTQHGLPEEADALRADLDGAVAELSGAIAELRELSQGLRPAHLDHGLQDALQELARRAPLPVEVDVPAEDLPDGVETTAYFVACEALTNAIKHAGASSVRIEGGRENGHLRLQVSDDGAGGAERNGGSGLLGMADRVAAVGGTLAIDSPSGAGTTVTVELPCAS
jgi:signal transduction histidine kinase